MSDIFISYAREDRLKAQQLAEALEGQGWGVWWDFVIPAGKKFGDVILEKLNTADAIVVLWSQTSVKSDWVLDEAEVAKKRNVLIPVFIERVSPPLGYGQIHAADLVGWDGSTDTSGFVRLVEDIEETIGPPRISASQSHEIHGVVPEMRYNPVDKAKSTYQELSHKKGDEGFFSGTARKMVHHLVNNRTIVQAVFLEGVKLYAASRYDEAYLKFLNLAIDGNEYAQNNLGEMYENGQGVERDKESAVKWYRLSAKQGNVGAQKNLKRLGLTW
jgi:hypothetical protein